MSRTATKEDVRKIIKNQETLYLMSLKNSMEIAKLTQSRIRARTNPGSKEPGQEAEEVFEIVLLSDDSASVSEVEYEVEDQTEYEGGEELEDDEDDEVQYEGDDEHGDQDKDDDEDEGQGGQDEYGRGRKRQRQP